MNVKEESEYNILHTVSSKLCIGENFEYSNMKFAILEYNGRMLLNNVCSIISPLIIHN